MVPTQNKSNCSSCLLSLLSSHICPSNQVSCLDTPRGNENIRQKPGAIPRADASTFPVTCQHLRFASILMCVLEAVQMAILSGIICRLWVPGASVLMCVLEAVQTAILSGSPCRFWVPGASVLMCVLKAVQVAILSGSPCRFWVPRASVLMCVLEAV